MVGSRMKSGREFQTVGPAINCEISSSVSLTSHVGAGSSWHDLFGAQLINRATSSVVTGVNSPNDDVTRLETSYVGVCSSGHVHGIDLVLEILGVVVSGIRVDVIASGITQYAVECPPQSLSVALVDASIRRVCRCTAPHRLYLTVPLQLVCTGTASSETPLSGSCVSTGGATVGVEPRRQ